MLDVIVVILSVVIVVLLIVLLRRKTRYYLQQTINSLVETNKMLVEKYDERGKEIENLKDPNFDYWDIHLPQKGEVSDSTLTDLKFEYIIKKHKNGDVLDRYQSLRQAEKETGISRYKIKQSCDNSGSLVKGTNIFFEYVGKV